MVGADQPVDHRRLVLLDAPDLRERQLQRLVHARAGVRKAERFELDAVHQDDAHARVRVVVELADRLLHQVAPGELWRSSGTPRFSNNVAFIDSPEREV